MLAELVNNKQFILLASNFKMISLLCSKTVLNHSESYVCPCHHWIARLRDAGIGHGLECSYEYIE
jgi:hypothetical protein